MKISVSDFGGHFPKT